MIMDRISLVEMPMTRQRSSTITASESPRASAISDTSAVEAACCFPQPLAQVVLIQLYHASTLR
jgi:hypothetical protein